MKKHFATSIGYHHQQLCHLKWLEVSENQFIEIHVQWMTETYLRSL